MPINNRERLTASNLDAAERQNYVSGYRIGGYSSMVEPQIVVLVVAGSSPVGHPIPSSSLLILILNS